MTTQRLLQAKPGTLTATLVDTNGDPAAPAGTVTVAVTSESGQVILPPGTATSAGSDTGDVEVSVTAAQTSQLDRWTATWSDGGNGSSQSSDHEVCGGFFFSVSQARAIDPSLQDTEKYPDATILAARQYVEEECEFICDVAFVPRYRRELCDGSAGPELYLAENRIRKIRSAMILTAFFSGGAEIFDPPVTSVVSNATSFTVTFESNHTLTPGDVLIMAGFVPTAYNGTWVVHDVPAGNQATILSNINPGSASTIGATWGATGEVVVFTPTQLQSIVIDDNLKIQRNDGGIWDEGRRNCILEYEHGHDGPPGELVDAAILRLKSVLSRRTRSVPDRATTFTTEGGTTFKLDSPDAFSTGIPEVDAVYERYSMRQYDPADQLPVSRTVTVEPQYYSVYHGGRR